MNPRHVARLRPIAALLALLAATLAWWPSIAAADEPLVPIAAFFSPPSIDEVKLSPSGKYLALTVPGSGGRLALAIVDTDLARPPVVVASDRRIDVRWFEWVNDDWLVFDLIDSQRGSGDQNFGAGLFSVRRDGSGSRVLIHSGADTTYAALSWSHALLFVPETGGTEVIVGEYRRDSLRELKSVTPKRVDVTNGRVTSVVLGYPNFTKSWVFDRDGNARVAMATHEGIGEVHWRPNGSSEEWKSLARAPYLDFPWSPVAIDSADALYVTKEGSDTTSVLTRFDFKTGTPAVEPIASTPGFDFQGSPLMAAGKVVGLRLQTDAETSIWFEPRRKAFQELVDRRFPGRVNRMSCSNCEADAVVLVHSFSDRAPGEYWIYREKQGDWTSVGNVRPAVDPRRMATLDLHRIKARDGTDLPIWITLPAQKAAAPRPAVVLVHGGPWLRGTQWHWDADAQFLASRGYVVIEPEFRGSRGYGANHFRKGWKNWGTTMQDDVADAARWAVTAGIVDPSRICIAGGSYGGYATLMGAIRYPDLYRCGIAYVAVTDPRLMFNSNWQNDSNREMREFSMPQMVGDLVKDADMLKAASPVERAKEIRIPILMAFGRDDMRVPIEHGARMRAAMQSAGHEPEYVVYEGEGHGWLKVENRIDFWSRVEKFLAKNLK